MERKTFGVSDVLVPAIGFGTWGKIRFIGVSNFDLWDLERAQIAKASTDEHIIENCSASGWRLSRAQYDVLCGIPCKNLHRGWFRAILGRYRRHGHQLLGRQL